MVVAIAGSRVTNLMSSLTQSLHRQRYLSTTFNRLSLRGMRMDRKDTSLQLRALYALQSNEHDIKTSITFK
jgi:hypothetical protein